MRRRPALDRAASRRQKCHCRHCLAELEIRRFAVGYRPVDEDGRVHHCYVERGEFREEDAER